MIRNDIFEPLVIKFLKELHNAAPSCDEVAFASTSIYMTNCLHVLCSQSDMSLHHKKECIQRDLKALYEQIIRALDDVSAKYEESRKVYEQGQP